MMTAMRTTWISGLAAHDSALYDRPTDPANAQAGSGKRAAAQRPGPSNDPNVRQPEAGLSFDDVFC
jgi:hypothetical protein